MRAIVHAGGGARGSFGAGVLCQLQTNFVYPDLIVGTSAGALNSAGYGSVGPVRLADAWGKITSWHDVYSVNYSAVMGMSDGLLDSSPLRKIIDNLVDTKCKRLKVFVTKTSLATSETVFGSNSDPDYLDTIQASTCIPAIVSPVGGFVDGGVVCNVPIQRAMNEGCTDITVIMCSPFNKEMIDPWQPTWKWFHGIEIAARAIDIMEDEMMRTQIMDAQKAGCKLTIYSPPTSFCGTLDFSQESIQKGIALGLNAKPLIL